MLSDTLQQYYADGRYVPREILVPAEIPDRELLEAWLTERRGTQRAHPRAPARREGAPRWSSWRGTRSSPSTRVEAPAQAVAGDPARARATCSTSRSSRAASSASTSRTSRARTSSRPWSCSRTGCPRSRTTASSRSAASSGARRLRLHARGGGTALPAAARGGEGAARPRAHRRRQGPAGAAAEALEELGLGDQPVGQPGQARGGDLPPGREEPSSCPATRRCCSSCSASGTKRTVSRSGSTVQVRSKRTCIGDWTTFRASGPPRGEAAVGVRVGARRPRGVGSRTGRRVGGSRARRG